MAANEKAQKFLMKAKEDIETVNVLLPHPRSPIASIGFHCQQACEKAMKAVLMTSTKEPDQADDNALGSHSLLLLASTLEKHGFTIPEQCDEAMLLLLSKYGVAMRYELVSTGAQIDRKQASELANLMFDWATEIILKA